MMNLIGRGEMGRRSVDGERLGAESIGCRWSDTPPVLDSSPTAVRRIGGGGGAALPLARVAALTTVLASVDEASWKDVTDDCVEGGPGAGRLVGVEACCDAKIATIHSSSNGNAALMGHLLYKENHKASCSTALTRYAI